MAITVSSGQPIRATHVNQFQRWLLGATKDVSTALATTHATEYTLTVTNEETSAGNALKIVSGASTVAIFNKTGATFTVPTTFASSVTFSSSLSLTGVQVGNGTLTAPSVAFSNATSSGFYRVTSTRWAMVVGGTSVMEFTSGAEFPQIGIGNISEPGPGGTANIMHIHWQNSTNTQGNVIALAAEITNNSTSASGSVPGDFSGISSYVYQTSDAANNAMRAFEGHAIALATGAGAHTNASIMAAELGVHLSNTGNGTTKHVGIYLTSHDASGQTNATMADSAIYILGTAGWANYIYGTNTAGALTFHVDNQGVIKSSTAANAAAPTYSWVGGAGFSDKGWYSAGSGLMGAAAGATEVARFAQTSIALTPNGTTAVRVDTSGFTSATRLVYPVVSPSVIATSTNDYAPTGGATAVFVQLQSTGSVNLTGYTVGQVTGVWQYLVNIGGANIVLQHNNTGSAASNRFNTHSSTDYTLSSAKGIAIYYTGSVWRTISE
jgi:hypothetical protein